MVAARHFEVMSYDEDVAHGFPEVIVCDPETVGRVFLATRSGLIFKSEDGGDSWDRLAVNVPDVASLRVSTT